MKKTSVYDDGMERGRESTWMERARKANGRVCMELRRSTRLDDIDVHMPHVDVHRS